jgi:uncharacterized protein YjbK
MSGNHGTEIEFKLRVDDLAALMRICIAARAAPSFTVVQRNEYLDTATRSLDAAKLVLRLREERSPAATTFFLTAKGPARKQNGGTLTEVAEQEVVVSVELAADLRSGRADALVALLDAPGCTPARESLVSALRAATGGAPLVLVGGFTNERTRLDVAFPEGFSGVLELDRVTFPGDQVHHEVEFEVPSDVDIARAQGAFAALFERASVTGRPAPGKASRFFRAQRGEKLA